MITGPLLQKSWDWRATGNFVGGGTGSGLMIMIMLTVSQGLQNFSLVPLAALFVVTGLGLVWLEIGRPWRFLNVYRNPYTSWMSRESYLATVLIPLEIAGYWLRSPSLLTWAAVFAVLFLYSQARMLKAARGIRAWRVPAIVPLLVSTGLLEGAGVLFVAWSIMAGLHAVIDVIEVTIVGWTLISLRLWAWSAYRDVLGSNVPAGTLAALKRVSGPFTLYGHVIPALLVLAAMLLPGLAAVFVFCAGLCVTLSGWAIKSVIVNQAGFNQGFELVHSPARGAGSPGPGARPGWVG